MKIIIDILEKAFNDKLELVTMLVTINAVLYLINIVYGTVLGTHNEGFNTKKFFYGILKWIIASFGIIAFSYTLNVFSLTLDELNVDFTITLFEKEFSADQMITILHVLAILTTWSYDLAKDILEKIKETKTLKYVTYDDLQIHENVKGQEGIG